MLLALPLFKDNDQLFEYLAFAKSVKNNFYEIFWNCLNIMVTIDLNVPTCNNKTGSDYIGNFQGQCLEGEAPIH